MCGGGHDAQDGRPPAAAPDEELDGFDDPNADEAFPWQSGRVYDAHCHPTDTVASLATIPSMGAAALTVMATRAQDQDLVASLADEQGVEAWAGGEEQRAQPPQRKVVPAFGWHPWFSHLLYDDGADDRSGGGEARDLTAYDDRRRHLASVLTPSLRRVPVEETGAKRAALEAGLDALAASLPVIRPLSAFVGETRRRLLARPAALVGEIGLDRAFRVPNPADAPSSSFSAPSSSDHTLTPGGREGRRLSPFYVRTEHQVAVMAAQLRLAAELGRPVSVHGAQAHGLLFDTLAATWRGHELLSRRQQRQERQNAQAEGVYDSDSESDDGDSSKNGGGKKTQAPLPFPPAICLHSFSGAAEVLSQYLDPRIPAAVYFSFSTAVNCTTPGTLRRTAEAVAACPDDRLLVESDLHTAGPQMDAALEAIYRRVCAMKSWPLAEGVERIAQNYDAFLLRAKPSPPPSTSKTAAGRPTAKMKP